MYDVPRETIQDKLKGLVEGSAFLIDEIVHTTKLRTVLFNFFTPQRFNIS